MADEIAEKADETIGRLRRWGKAFGGFVTWTAKGYVALWQITIPVTLIVLAGLLVAWLTYQSDSENEREAENQRQNTIVQDAETNVQANKVEQAEDRVEEAEKASQKARKERERANQTDSSVNADRNAQKRFCERFVDDSTCVEKR